MTAETEGAWTEPDEAETERQLEAQRQEAFDPFSRERSGEWLAMTMGNRQRVTAEELPLHSQDDLLMSLSAVAYAQENGFSVQVEDDFTEKETMTVRSFTISRKGEQSQ